MWMSSLDMLTEGWVCTCACMCFLMSTNTREHVLPPRIDVRSRKCGSCDKEQESLSEGATSGQTDSTVVVGTKWKSFERYFQNVILCSKIKIAINNQSATVKQMNRRISAAEVPAADTQQLPSRPFSYEVALSRDSRRSNEKPCKSTDSFFEILWWSRLLDSRLWVGLLG